MFLSTILFIIFSNVSYAQSSVVFIGNPQQLNHQQELVLNGSTDAIKIPHFERFFNQPTLTLELAFIPQRHQLSYLVKLFSKETYFEIVLNHLTDKPQLSGKIFNINFEKIFDKPFLKHWQHLKMQINFEKQLLDIFLNGQLIIQQTNLHYSSCQTADLIIGGFYDLQKNYHFKGSINNLTINTFPIFQIKSSPQIHITSYIFSILILSILIYGVFYYRNRNIRLLLQQPERLFEYPIIQIPTLYQHIHKKRSFQTFLKSLQLTEDEFKKNIFFITTSNAQFRCNFLFKKLPCVIHTETRLENLFYIEFTGDFPLNLHHVYVYFPSNQLTQIKIKEQLYQHLPFETILVINLQQTFIQTERQDYIFVSAQELTLWLFHHQPLLNFCHFLSKHIDLNRLSPFQGQSSTYFRMLFQTRKSIIQKLLQQPLQNYILIGGRQIGKTSILRFLNHYYQTQIQFDCYYKVFQLSQIKEIVQIISKVTKPCLFLIDEVDDLIQHQPQIFYKIIQQFQNFTVQRKAFFVVAGYWETYIELFKTPSSPFKNFGESITIQPLETEVAQQFLEESLAYLNCKFERSSLAKILVETLGGRANLIMKAGHQLLSLNKSQFSQQEIEQVLNFLQQDILNNIGLTEKLEKIIVLAGLLHDQQYFTPFQLLEVLEHFHFSIQENILFLTLERLTLAGILSKEKTASFQIGIPLLKKAVDHKQSLYLISQEIKY